MTNGGQWYSEEPNTPQAYTPGVPVPSSPEPQWVAATPIQQGAIEPAWPQTPGGDMLLSIGDIAIYADRVVTPGGSFSHQGLTWVVRDNTTITEGIPPYAIVMAILLFVVCFLGLFFLLIKEQKIQGYVEVSVQSDSKYHVTQIPISKPEQIQFIRQQVDYARGLAHYA